MNFEKGANVSTMGFIAQGDLTNLNSTQTTAIFTGGATKNAVERVSSVLSIYNQGKAAGEGMGRGLPSAQEASNKVEVIKPNISTTAPQEP